VAILALRSVFDPKVGRQHLPRILGLAQQLTEKESAVECIQTVLSYLGATNPHLTEEEVIDALQQTFVDERSDIMPTIAEKYYQEGIEQGIEQGAVHERRDIVRTMYAKGLVPSAIAEMTDMTVEQVYALLADHEDDTED